MQQEEQRRRKWIKRRKKRKRRRGREKERKEELKKFDTLENFLHNSLLNPAFPILKGISARKVLAQYNCFIPRKKLGLKKIDKKLLKLNYSVKFRTAAFTLNSILEPKQRCLVSRTVKQRHSSNRNTCYYKRSSFESAD